LDIAISVLIVFGIGILAIRALLFAAKDECPVTAETVVLDEGPIVSHLAEMIRCKTVSYDINGRYDRSEFDKFGHLLEELYPAVTSRCKREKIAKTGLLYRWEGKQADQPIVLMSHYDVVPADETLWTKPPFEGIIEEGVVWGRGTLDTKGTLCAILESAESLIQQGFVPEQDIYFSFSGEEEISGDSTPAIVEYLHERDVHPALVLDEGGAVVEDIFPGVKRASALIGTGEKGYLDVILEMSGQGGHSSAPPPHSLVGILAKAVVRIERRSLRAHLTPPVLEMFQTLGSHSGFAIRLIFANLWLFLPLLSFIYRRKGGELNALLRTTCAVTMMEGSPVFNVMPPQARIGLNLRLLPGDTVERVMTHLRKVIRDDIISLSIAESSEASPMADTGSKEWKRLRDTISQTWPSAIVAPYLMLGASDSRHYCRICDNVFRFSAMKLSEQELGLIHGNDERIQVSSLLETVAFYTRLMRQS
jgi:carboxypeptidase PM20D1